MAVITRQILVKGKVQGVFFRASAKEVAEENNLTGWVRNTNNSDVESVVAGEEEKVSAFIRWCRQGPRRAVVTEVIVTPTALQLFQEFKVRRGE